VKASELKNMTVAEIENSLISLKEKLFELRQEITTGRVERPHRIGELKKDIARCYTILKEKTSGK
jgi:large subunit ribosomal protein L29